MACISSRRPWHGEGEGCTHSLELLDAAGLCLRAPLRRNPQASRPNCADDAVIFDAQAFQHDPEVAEEFAVEAFIAQLVMKALRVSLARGAAPGR